jgi:hypothetical protein
MMDVSTVALNMTFLLTLGIGFLIFLAHILIFTTMLMLAGTTHLAALTFTALWHRLRLTEVTNHRSKPARDRETLRAKAFPNLDHDAHGTTASQSTATRMSAVGARPMRARLRKPDRATMHERQTVDSMARRSTEEIDDEPDAVIHETLRCHVNEFLSLCSGWGRAIQLDARRMPGRLWVRAQQTLIEDEHCVVVDLLPQLYELFGCVRPWTPFDHDELVLVI